MSARSLGRWWDVGVVLLLSVIGIIGFRPPFADYSFLIAGAGGLAVGAAVAVVAARFRLPAVLSVLAAIVAFFLFGTAFAVPGLGLLWLVPTLQSLAALAVGAVFGWADVVTLQTPIGAPDYINVVPYTASWLVGFVSTTLALRWLGESRSILRLAVVMIGPVLLYLGSILIGTDQAYFAGLRGIGFASTALVWVGWRRRAQHSVAAESANALSRRKLGGTVALLASAIVLGTVAAVVLAPPAESRFVLRDEIEPPFYPLDYPSPLAGFRHYTKVVPEAVQFTVEGMQAGDRIRLATMDSFSGKLWNVTGSETQADGTGSFALVGRNLPSPDFMTVDHESEVRITVGSYNDVWVPGVGYPTDIEFVAGEAAEAQDDLRFNAASGSAMLLGGLREGDSFVVNSVVQRVPTADELSDVNVASVPLPPVYDTPDVVTAKAGEFAGGASTPAAILETISRTLADTGFLSHGTASDSVASRAGHGADRIEELLTRSQLIGDQEQYASAYALMARSLGYPARVVMGFAPEVTDGQQSVEVLGADVTAWVEVAFDGIGWVPYDPTPDETDIPQDEIPQPKTEPQPQVRQPPRVESEDDELITPVELEESDSEDDELFGIPTWVYFLGLGVLIPAAIVFLPMLVAMAIRARRRARRRSAEAGHVRAAGAWEELVDRYAELGYEPPQRTTRVLTARELERQLGSDGSPLAALATDTDHAVFSGTDVAPEQTERLWTEAEGAIATARAAVSRSRRWLSRYRINRARKTRSRGSRQ